MIVTTGDLHNSNYEIIDIVFAYGSSGGLLKTANPMEAYPKVKDLLVKNAAKVNADALIAVHFDYRVAVKSGCGAGSQVFEVFAYGTAVKLK